jgi:hypothetical protein
MMRATADVTRTATVLSRSTSPRRDRWNATLLISTLEPARLRQNSPAQSSTVRPSSLPSMTMSDELTATVPTRLQSARARPAMLAGTLEHRQQAGRQLEVHVVHAVPLLKRARERRAGHALQTAVRNVGAVADDRDLTSGRARALGRTGRYGRRALTVGRSPESYPSVRTTRKVIFSPQMAAPMGVTPQSATMRSSCEADGLSEGTPKQRRRAHHGVDTAGNVQELQLVLLQEHQRAAGDG